MDVSIVIPVFNQLHFTKICIESLQATLLRDGEIIVIDNGSSDGTAEYLLGFSNIRIITNGENLGCAVAWNQGVRASNASWIAILNNDIILSTNWLNGLLDFAREKNVDIVSPAFREGEYNYNIAEYSREYVQRMYSVARMGIAQGICFVVRRRVFDKIGLFDENFKIGQLEDTDFFRRARRARFILGTTGRSLIHHFGSITQDSIRRRIIYGRTRQRIVLIFAENTELTLWKRFLERRYVKLRDLRWRISERTIYGHTLIEKWVDGRVRYL